MKKLIILLLILLVIKPTHAALNAATVWEVRTTGTQASGGGFYNRNPGTSVDYSQQAAAQLSLTDLAATQASGWLTLTSATGGFTAAMAGNIIHITAGTNDIAGWYEITAYTNGNTVTVDRACGSVGDMSAGVGAVGGAFLIGGTLDDDFTEAMIAGNTVYVATGTYTLGESIIQVVDGTAVAPIKWIGYTSTRDDTTVGTDRPLFACAAYAFATGDYSIFKNFRFTTTYLNGFQPRDYNVMINCKSQNTSGTSNYDAIYSGIDVQIISSEASCTNGKAINTTSGSLYAIGCYVHDSVTGFYLGNNRNFVFSCVSDTCTTGINCVAQVGQIITNNTIYNCTTGITGTTASRSQFINNIITGCMTGASWTTATPSNTWDFNCWNNTTDVSNVTKGPHDITADPLLTDPANGDFTLQAGSPCLDAGLQIGANEGVTGDYKINIGVDQDDNTAAGGAGATVYMGNF